MERRGMKYERNFQCSNSSILSKSLLLQSLLLLLLLLLKPPRSNSIEKNISCQYLCRSRNLLPPPTTTLLILILLLCITFDNKSKLFCFSLLQSDHVGSKACCDHCQRGCARFSTRLKSVISLVMTTHKPTENTSAYWQPI